MTRRTINTNVSIPQQFPRDWAAPGPAATLSASLRRHSGTGVGHRLRRAALAFVLTSMLSTGAPAPALASAEAPATPPTATTPVPLQSASASPGSTTPVPATEATKLDPESDRRLRALSDELRCLVCQNQTLADSNAELAVDLRRQVETMIARGNSDAQIKTYLVDRYGDFVLYRPPVQNNTALLWFGPFALLVIGAIVWVLVPRRSRRAVPAQPVSSDAERRVRSLLGD